MPRTCRQLLFQNEMHSTPKHDNFLCQPFPVQNDIGSVKVYLGPLHHIKLLTGNFIYVSNQSGVTHYTIGK